MLGETVPPNAHRLTSDADRIGYRAAVHAGGGAQHDVGALCFATGNLPPPHEPLKSAAFSSVSLISFATFRRAMPSLRIR
jgi:hypothetical protein